MAYIFVCFFIIPAVFMGFSLAGTACFAVMITITLLIAAFVLIVSVLQRKKPSVLPEILRTWEFLPMCACPLQPLAATHAPAHTRDLHPCAHGNDPAPPPLLTTCSP